MRKLSFAVMSAGLVMAIAASNIIPVIHDGRNLDELRDSVVRLHILADSDSKEDQEVKLKVRDALLENSGEIFGDTSDMESVLCCAEENLPLIEEIADNVLTENGFSDEVHAEITDMYFDERTYGDITMPSGNYKALRVTLGSAQGKNWWCVMYPPLCLPAALGRYEVENDEEDSSEDISHTGTERDFFSEEECDILCSPEKYRVRFAIWDKLKSIFDF